MLIAVLISMGVLWLMAYAAAYRWCGAIGVDCTASRLALGAIVPSALFVGTIHVLAVSSLLMDAALLSQANIAFLFASLVVAVLWFARRRCAVLQPVGCERTVGLKSMWWPVAIVACTYVVFTLDAMTRYPTGADALHYHLPVVLSWIQSSRMDAIVGLAHQSFPENGMFVPLMMLFAGWERGLNVAQLPNAIFLGLTIYALTIRAGASRDAAIGAACIALSIPVVLFQSFSSYIDLYAATGWMLSLLAVAWFVRLDGNPSRWVLVCWAGLAAGIALGSKTTYIALVPLLALVMFLAYRNLGQRNMNSWRGGVAGLAIFSLACVPCSVHWFVRGAIQAGNPVYPLTFEVGGEKILPGFVATDQPHFVDRTLREKIGRWWDYPWSETKYSGTGYPYGRGNGFGAAFACFVPAGLIGVMWNRRRYLHEEARFWQLMYLAMSIVGVVLLLTAFREMIRFVLPFVLISVPLAGVLFDRLRDRFPRLPVGLLCASLVVTSAIAGLQPAHAMAGRMRDGVWSRDAFYGMPALLDDFPLGTRIVNVANAYATYALMGEDANNVAITPIHWELLTGDGELSRDSLLGNSVDYVFATEAQSVRWASDLPLEPVVGGEARSSILFQEPGRLFRVIPSAHVDSR